MPAKSLMIQGTTSDAGKSTLAMGLCRWLARRGFRVAPFKPQNMALNSAVTVDGGEIGRAQALQAVACGIEAHTDMNPVLLKPSTNVGAQLIVQGKVWSEMDARTYHQHKPTVMPYILESYRRLSECNDRIVIEGAGSPAEINLRDGDVANMGFAEAIDCPVVLVADIDRGGVFAHLTGTIAVLAPSEQQRIKGFVINKFRGDVSLLTPGIDWLEKHTGVPVLGVIPYMEGLVLDPEDSLARKDSKRKGSGSAKLHIVVPALPRMSNETDFLPLQLHSAVSLEFIKAGESIPPADLVILPGSKSVRSDLAWLIENDWAAYLRRHLRYGGKLIGVCGGFQMLGNELHDPHGMESQERVAEGLRLLDMTTELKTDKTLKRVRGELNLPGNPHFEGYEIHLGISTGAALTKPAALTESGRDGAISEDGLILGTYMHGLFDTPTALRAILDWAGLSLEETFDFQNARECSINAVVDVLEAHLALDVVERIFMSKC